ncbi:MAG: DUF1926 domain-containing protein [bacterium]|nr:DUF1926 domain-containing protein [bacterium]
MAKAVELTLVIHNHQPVGNFDHVFEQSCERAYLPFLRTLLEYPAVRIGLHTSGCLWEWVEGCKPEYGNLVDELLARGQLELLGGGMYEPILPVWPARDSLRQLERLSRFLQERFSISPTGAWIPERVWEPHLPELLAKAGMKYCLLDDYHFVGNASADKIATDYFMTSHASSEVALLPISKELRYMIPFKPVVDTMDYLCALADNSEHAPLAVFGDDGEKFGVWPDTYEWVYTQGWLRQFLQALTDNSDWIKLKLPSEVLANRAPADNVYIPARSYFEMGEWTRIGSEVCAEGSLPGHWRNFLSKYPESRQLYERVCAVSSAMDAGGPEVSTEAWDDLLRAQCNCCYWHGVFGGLYLNYLRAAVSRHMLKAERSIGGAGVLPAFKSADVTSAQSASRLANDTLSLSVHSEHGLSVSRIDYYPTLFNWGDVLARRREAYHDKLEEAQHTEQHAEGQASIHEIVRTKEPGLERWLVVDPHPRHSFVTYFCSAVSAEQFMYIGSEQLRTFEDWYVSLAEVLRDEDEHEAGLSAVVNFDQFWLSKGITLKSSSLMFSLLAGGELPKHDDFYVEFNVTALTDRADDRYLIVDDQRYPLDVGHASRGVSTLSVVDEWQQRRIVLTPSIAAKLITYPVYTVSSSEGGFERTYQGTCIMLGFDPGLLTTGLTIALRIEEL